MPSKNAERVVCNSCGWRGRRVYRGCECDAEFGCVCGPLVAFGACGGCGGRRSLCTPDELREFRENDAATEAFLKSPEAAEIMARLDPAPAGVAQ